MELNGPWQNFKLITANANEFCNLQYVYILAQQTEHISFPVWHTKHNICICKAFLSK